MRIRQIRPEFGTDETTAALAPAVRLFYIGLWNVCDDAGWMEWRPSRIGAVLFPYESPKRREREIAAWGEALTTAGRLVIHECGCAQVPTLPNHQRVAGKPSFVVRDAHSKHLVAIRGYLPLSGSPVELSRVEVSRVSISTEELLSLRDAEDDDDRQRQTIARKLHA